MFSYISPFNPFRWPVVFWYFVDRKWFWCYVLVHMCSVAKESQNGPLWPLYHMAIVSITLNHSLFSTKLGFYADLVLEMWYILRNPFTIHISNTFLIALLLLLSVCMIKFQWTFPFWNFKHFYFRDFYLYDLFFHLLCFWINQMVNNNNNKRNKKSQNLFFYRSWIIINGIFSMTSKSKYDRTFSPKTFLFYPK